MFDYQGYVAKAQLYFQRAEAAQDEAEKGIWQLLAFEFVLRAPLAKLSPSLLAHHEGDSILYAAGVQIPAANVRSTTSIMVLSRLEKVIAGFGRDRVEKARKVLSIRNSELHNSEAVVATSDRQDWLPALLDVVDAVCGHLGLKVSDVMTPGQQSEAAEYREAARDEIQGEVRKKTAQSRDFASRLSASEVSMREAAIPPQGTSPCPACGRVSLIKSWGGSTVDTAVLDEATNEVNYAVIRVVRSASCDVCGLDLANTAEVVAAGLSRTDRYMRTEARYDGWQEMVTVDELMEAAQEYSFEPEYMDE